MGLVDAAQERFLRIHQALYEATRGVVGHRMIGVPSLLMTSVGRRSGKARTAALVYAEDGESYIVVASNGGADRPPAWLHNVEANPDVQVRIGRRQLAATAAVIGPDSDEYTRLWELVNRGNHGRYDAYQAKTSRPIALVRLQARGPLDGPSARLPG